MADNFVQVFAKTIGRAMVETKFDITSFHNKFVSKMKRSNRDAMRLHKQSLENKR